MIKPTNNLLHASYGSNGGTYRDDAALPSAIPLTNDNFYIKIKQLNGDSNAHFGPFILHVGCTT